MGNRMVKIMTEIVENLSIDWSCDYCKHFHEDKITCDAFPDGIPEPLLLSRAAHNQPYRGDRGIQFENKWIG